MSWSRSLVLAFALAALAVPARAGIFFKKHAKVDPAQRVPELIVAVKTDPDERKRAAAAAELRQYDPKAFPDIVPILADVLLTDAKPSVRLEAAQSLSRMRPISPEAGMALEKAAASDAALRVRMQARKYLIYYRLAGYHSPKTKDTPEAKPPAGTKGEPPLAPPDAAPNPNRLTPVPSGSGSAAPPATETAKPKPARPLPDLSVAQPLPAGPAKKVNPPPPPKPQTAPPPPAKEQGPELY
jgi:hypothetical protein